VTWRTITKYQYLRAAEILVSGKANLDRGNRAPGWCRSRSVVPGLVVPVLVPVVVVLPAIAIPAMIINLVVPSVLLVDDHFLHAVAARVMAIVVPPVYPIDHDSVIAVTPPMLAMPVSHPLHHNDPGRIALDDDYTAGLSVTRVFVSHDNAAGDWTTSDDNLT